MRLIDEDGLLRVIRAALPTGTHGRETTVAAVTRWLSRQPKQPRLVGTTAAAKILGVQPPHITALRERGRMPDPIEVEGSVSVYNRDEIVALAREIKKERRERERRRQKRAKENE